MDKCGVLCGEQTCDAEIREAGPAPDDRNNNPSCLVQLPCPSGRQQRLTLHANGTAFEMAYTLYVVWTAVRTEQQI